MDTIDSEIKNVEGDLPALKAKVAELERRILEQCNSSKHFKNFLCRISLA
jgi:hypothetical protein